MARWRLASPGINGGALGRSVRTRTGLDRGWQSGVGRGYMPPKQAGLGIL